VDEIDGRYGDAAKAESDLMPTQQNEQRQSLLDDLMTIEAASRRVHKSRDYCRQLAIASGIAVRWGGTDEHPRLKVKLSDLERAILGQRHVETKGKPTKFRRVAMAYSPDVKC